MNKIDKKTDLAFMYYKIKIKKPSDADHVAGVTILIMERCLISMNPFSKVHKTC